MPIPLRPEVFYHELGPDRIRKHIIHKFKGLNIAVHYGCHILRPRDLVQFARPGTAAVFDELVAMTGADLVPWHLQSECCGSPLWGIDDDLSATLTRKKITDLFVNKKSRRVRPWKGLTSALESQSPQRSHTIQPSFSFFFKNRALLT